MYDGSRPCSHVPSACTRYNAVYTILHYLVDDRFMAPEVRKSAQELRHVYGQHFCCIIIKRWQFALQEKDWQKQLPLSGL